MPGEQWAERLLPARSATPLVEAGARLGRGQRRRAPPAFPF
jgi:hypothetical protein